MKIINYLSSNYKDYFFRICLIFLLFHISTGLYAQNTRITLPQKQLTIAQAFDEIQRQTKMTIAFNESVIDSKKIITPDITNKSLNEALTSILKGTGATFRIQGKQIIIIAEPSSKGAIKLYSGVITDNQGEPIIGASVTIKGTYNGTLTDMDGKFTISAGIGATLSISYIGFTPKDILLGENSTLRIILEENIQTLDDVVVVGYGTQKKINLTGAISQVNADELKDRPVNNMTQILQGAIPNLNISIGTGKPGEGGSLNIRGNTSLSSGGAPFVLIDGVPGNIDRVNPNDVESVTVLKDASASAIYGARAAFGVILVTTKSAQDGKTQIKYSNNFAWTTHATSTDFITSGFWNGKINDIAMYNSLGITSLGYTDEDYDELWQRVNDKTEHPERPWVVVKPNTSGKDMYRYYGNFDWYNYLYSKWRGKSNHNVTLTGSSGKIKYLMSGGFAEETGILKINPDKYKRFDFRTKVSVDITDWLTISNNTSFFKSKYKWHGKADNFNVNNSSVTTNPIYFYHPAYVPVNPDGTITGYTGMNNYQVGYGNHANWLNGKAVGNKDDSDLLSIYEANIKVMKGLTLTANYAYGEILSQYNYRQVRVQYSLYPGELDYWKLADLSNDKYVDAASVTKKHSFNAYGNYDIKFKDHNIKVTAGFNQEWQHYKIITGRGYDLLSETLNDLSLTSGNMEVQGGLQEWAVRGAFYRANYDYKGKYLLETSGRYDGSSRFPKDSRFAFFPSFSVGWRMSEESFLKFMKPAVDNLKFRYSYGSLGNQLTSNYGYIESMSPGIISYLVNGEKLGVTNVAAPISRNYTWEKAITNNFGLDVDLFNARLSASADYYIRDTKDMLMPGKTLPAVYGASSPKENAADLRTKGFEISLTWRDKFTLANKPFSYSVKAMLSDYTAKVTKFDNPERVLSDYYVGQQLGEIWGYSYDGLFQSNEEAQAWASIVNQDKINKRRMQAPTAELQKLQAGDIKILDLDGNGIIDVGANTVDDPGDQRIIGNTQPRYSYGLTLGANWNGFDISAFFQGIGRQHWYPHKESQMFWQVYSRPYSSFIPIDFMSQVWTPENPNAYFPLMRGYIAQNSELSVANDMYLQDLAYCKLRNLTIGYTLSENLLKKTKIVKNARIYVSGENLFTWTKLKSDYIDPQEVMSDPTGRTYPMGRTLSFGIEVSF